MYKNIFYCILAVFLVTAVSSCGKEGPEGKPGQNGQNGKDGSVVTISSDGFWVIDGVKQSVRAVGIPPSISTDGFWVIDGEKTTYKALGSVVTISSDGYWVIDGEKTNYKAEVDIGTDNVFTVSFNSNGGSNVHPEKVILGGKAKEPNIPARNSFVPHNSAEAGLYPSDGDLVDINYKLAGWYIEGETEPFDFDVPITGNVNLKAEWTSNSIDFGATGTDDFDKVIAYVNTHPAEYTLLLDEDISVAGSTSRALDVAGTKLTLAGLGGEQKISLTSMGRILTVGTDGVFTNAELVLGNNITLVGLTDGINGALIDNNGSVITVYGLFTMLNGSKVTGNTSSSSTAPTGEGAAVLITGTGATFTMKGGKITGNNSTTTVTGVTSTAYAGLNARANTIVTLEGGEITGNEGVSPLAQPGDVFIDRSIFTLSGTAKVGTLNTHFQTPALPPTAITIASGWTGEVGTLNLSGNATVFTGVYPLWMGAGGKILQGDGLSAATVAKFPLGLFIAQSTGSNQSISTTHYIDDTGYLRVNP